MFLVKMSQASWLVRALTRFSRHFSMYSWLGTWKKSTFEKTLYSFMLLLLVDNFLPFIRGIVGVLVSTEGSRNPPCFTPK